MIKIINKKSEKAQSQIVGTVLLILITVIAAGLIMSFTVPFIKEKLSSGDCLDVLNKVKIRDGYTCYNSTNGINSTNVQIHIDEVRDLIKGFYVELGGPSSKTMKVLLADHPNVVMYGGGNFELPNNTEERTYILYANTLYKPTYIAVYPVLKNTKVCDASSTILEIDYC